MFLGVLLSVVLRWRQSVVVHYCVTHSTFDHSLRPGLTDEEVELAIQRSGSVEEALALSPSGSPHMVHSPPLVPAAYSECQSTSIIQTRDVYTNVSYMYLFSAPYIHIIFFFFFFEYFI